MQFVSLFAPLVVGTLVAAQGSSNGQPTDIGIQDSVWAYGNSKCHNSRSQVDDIMIDCLDPRSAQTQYFTTHSADEYTDTVPTAFKSFHGSDAGLGACVVSPLSSPRHHTEDHGAQPRSPMQYSFNSTTTKVGPNDFKYALASVKVQSSECSNVPATHTLSFLNKAQKIKKVKTANGAGNLAAKAQTHGSAVQGNVHRYVCLLENACRVANL